MRHHLISVCNGGTVHHAFPMCGKLENAIILTSGFRSTLICHFCKTVLYPNLERHPYSFMYQLQGDTVDTPISHGFSQIVVVSPYAFSLNLCMLLLIPNPLLSQTIPSTTCDVANARALISRWYFLAYWNLFLRKWQNPLDDKLNHYVKHSKHICIKPGLGEKIQTYMWNIPNICETFQTFQPL